MIEYDVMQVLFPPAPESRDLPNDTNIQIPPTETRSTESIHSDCYI